MRQDVLPTISQLLVNTDRANQLKEKTMRQGCIILADRHSNMLAGVRRLLEEEVETTLMVSDEISLFHALENFEPDVVVADFSLPTSTKTNIAWVLNKKFPRIKVIILSDNDEKTVLDEVMAAGVEGFVLKYRAVLDLIPAVREVRRGRKYISLDIT